MADNTNTMMIDNDQVAQEGNDIMVDSQYNLVWKINNASQWQNKICLYDQLVSTNDYDNGIKIIMDKLDELNLDTIICLTSNRKYFAMAVTERIISNNDFNLYSKVVNTNKLPYAYVNKITILGMADIMSKFVYDNLHRLNRKGTGDYLDIVFFSPLLHQLIANTILHDITFLNKLHKWDIEQVFINIPKDMLAALVETIMNNLATVAIDTIHVIVELDSSRHQSAEQVVEFRRKLCRFIIENQGQNQGQGQDQSRSQRIIAESNDWFFHCLFRDRDNELMDMWSSYILACPNTIYRLNKRVINILLYFNHEFRINLIDRLCEEDNILSDPVNDNPQHLHDVTCDTLKYLYDVRSLEHKSKLENLYLKHYVSFSVTDIISIVHHWDTPFIRELCDVLMISKKFNELYIIERRLHCRDESYADFVLSQIREYAPTLYTQHS